MMQHFGQGFEGLEERTLLAANVTATLVGDTLIVEGDATANTIDVFGDGTNGNVGINVNGQTLEVNGGTQVDGDDGTFTGVQNIVIRGNGGDDDVHVADININGNLTLQGGFDADDLYLHADNFDTFIGGSVVMNGGLSQDDYLEVETFGYGDLSIDINGGLAMVNFGGYGGLFVAAEYGNINIGGGVMMNSFSLPGSYGSAIMRADYGNLSVGGSVVMNGGLGDDLLGIFAGYGATAYGTSKTGVSIGGGVIMNGGWGDDEELITAYGYGFSVPYGAAPAQPVGLGVSNNIEIAGSVAMLGGVGDDRLSVGGIGADVSIGGSLAQSGGFGCDEIESFGINYGIINIAGNVLMDGGAGNDFIGAYGTVVGGSALILGGSGDDGVELDANTVNGSVAVLLQTGNDTLCAENNTIGGSALLAGGLGFDGAFIGFNDVNGFVIPVGFEEELNFCPFDQPT